jgi:hypothetical protein
MDGSDGLENRQATMLDTSATSGGRQTGPLCTCPATTIDPWDISRTAQHHRRRPCGYFLLQILSQYHRCGPRP